MKLPFAGLDESDGVWPIPQNGTDLRQMSLLLQSFPNPVSVDLEGVYLALDADILCARMDELISPSLRKLTMREVLVPSSAFATFFNLTNVFPRLEDLSIVNLLFDSATLAAGLESPPPWGGDLKISKLLLEHVSGLLNLLPNTAFRNVRQLNIPMLSLLIPDAARFLIPLYDTLEELTLGVGQFGLNDIARNSFELSRCSRLHSLHFIQAGTTAEPDMAVLFMVNVNACLRIAPSHLRHVSIGLLPYTDITLRAILNAPTWDATQEILRYGPLQSLHSLKVAIVPEYGRHPKKIEEVVEYETLPLQGQQLLKDRFAKGALEKLIF